MNGETLNSFIHLIPYLIAFFIIALSAERISGFFKKIHLPGITGVLITGILVGPYVLKFLSKDAIHDLKFINEVALSFIAFAAGTELYFPEIRDRIKNIGIQTTALIVSVFVLSTISIFFLCDYIPFAMEMTTMEKMAVSILGATIFVARSPSSAIAIIREMRAKGPFVKTTIGVTVVIDFAVIVLFALMLSIALNLYHDKPMNAIFFVDVITELVLDVVLGYLVFKWLSVFFNWNFRSQVKAVLLLLTGFAVYIISHGLKVYSGAHWPFEIHVEPLLVCIIASFLATNRSNFRLEFKEIIEEVGPYVYVVFFVYTGAHLAIDVFVSLWKITVVLFFVRVIAVFIGARLGAVLSKEKMKYRNHSWMGFITQAGVGIGLASVVANEFPAWGEEFNALILAVIVINELVGPPLFKMAIKRMGESHLKHDVPDFDGVKDVLIFGVESQSFALASQLNNHGWNAEIVCVANSSSMIPDGVVVHHIPNLDEENLKKVKCSKAEAVVLMLTDEENYKLAETIYEHVGTKEVIVRLNNRKYFDKFHELGALIVNPETAMVSLMDNFVRSPNATSLLLGYDEDQETIDIEVRDKSFHGIQLKHLRLPGDVIVLSVMRNQHAIITHGYTRLRLGDVLTVVGSHESLEDLERQLAMEE